MPRELKEGLPHLVGEQKAAGLLGTNEIMWRPEG